MNNIAYPSGVALLSTFFLTYLSIKVSQQRSVAGVPYPYMYADKSEAETNAAKKLFNCYQRAHQNTLENYPIFLVLLGIASVEHPTTASIAGLVWLVGRYFYAQGYYTGDPKQRMRGGFSYLGLLTLLGLSIKTIYTGIF